jgi:hypothetical protein
MWHKAIVVVVVMLAAYAVYILSAIPQAWLEFKERPREKMEWCHKHGFYRRKHVLPFMGTTVCPRCYLEAWNTAPERNPNGGEVKR